MAAVEKNNIRILLIDDDEAIRSVFSEILRSEGYPLVEVAADGAEALSLFKEYRFNVAFVDLYLPDIDGIELISKLRSLSDFTEFIIVTGYGSLDSAIKALQFDVGGYLEKPISSSKLIRTLETCLEKQRLKVENRRFLEELEQANTEVRFLNDLLINNVNELNQSLLMTLDLASETGLSLEQEKVLKLFHHTIRKNARLTNNIRRLKEISQISLADLSPCNLTESLSKAIDRLRGTYWDKDFEVKSDLSEERTVLADKNLHFLFYELFSIAILNDPKSTVKISVDFTKTSINSHNYWKISFNSFFAKLVYDQRNISDPSKLEISPTDQSFQDLGPFVINALVRIYHGFVDVSKTTDGPHNLDLYLPTPPKENLPDISQLEDYFFSPVKREEG
ncbi:MAG: response regulator [Candidatus Heimdallarchaeota archaeon]|nr:response regulator [Candidatus Heimdallarchaeota archaeon]